ncbi:hypothetical protein F383_05916 [Gossypium arboreum]|uniref:Uncharacterized protein n=7 Tax=Gossypium TaxID=3633 RepID=A0ABR0NV62_GOSAR|nr:FCS-Like Zinc finger 15 [Gossypium hirsutum]XP_017610222.1 FCS-Like Zinc finger 15-like [Gossypium arboreum]KAB2067792.1 hypothetical protein ES319_A09G252600v1 [Gossypium barbadense]TYH04176.1 hypothetical protein ES288_A09G278400v1 [Gossypium darwinii]TYI12407.1 hypothetical protein ES332_A09G275600v1 [Gossypium tomentosum]TYJ20340.1 hypothetical protein E1A91_A09G257800v1 [Gossypium mustelinum]KAG4185538.1 hypothetical protein ERO13_A09G237800v2 [Gossypium hirsutum]
MVGLSVVLENQRINDNDIIINEKSPQVINKATMFCSSSSSPLPAFLEQCFLCKRRLLPGKDIYMYKGDKGFCSVECRCKQIFMDEEESLKKDSCSLDAIVKPSSTSVASTSSSSSAARHHRKPERNRAGGFAY